MANYNEWNDALVEYFTGGAPVGSTIYLNVSEATLELIGAQFWDNRPTHGWKQDFLEAVRTALVEDGCVFLDRVKGKNQHGVPNGVAFLGVLVFTANQMDNDLEENIHQKDFFTRFNEILTTQPANSQVKRPKYMTFGAEGEEPLWKMWEQYLRRLGYLPTASGGEGSWKYIGYSVSQAMIREPEKRRLFEVFKSRGWVSDLDPDYLVQQLEQEPRLPGHVEKLLRRSGNAAEDVADALYEVYQEWRTSGEDATSATQYQTQRRNLPSGLYRTEHPRRDEPFYALFPRQPRHLRQMDIWVEWPDGESEQLREDRPGYYESLGQVTNIHLKEGCKFQLSGHPLLETLALPERKVWALRADPDNLGAYASLGKPEVGEHLLLLADVSLSEQLEQLREDAFIQWKNCTPVFDGDWLEYEGLMVLSYRWNNLEGIDQQLIDALRPRKSISLSISGGLRLGGSQTWLKDNPPQIVVNSFKHNVELTVEHDGKQILQQNVERDAPIDVPWSGSGYYTLTAEVDIDGQKDAKGVNLVDWNELSESNADLLGKFATEWSQDGETYYLKGATLVPENAELP